MRTLIVSMVTAAAAVLVAAPLTPASAARVGSPTVVLHDVTFTEVFDGDICGPRATTVHDFVGPVTIFYRFHTTQHGEEIVVEREVLKVTGCP